MSILPLSGENNIYSYFENGDAPNGNDFRNLIDTCIGTNSAQNASVYTTVNESSANWNSESGQNVELGEIPALSGNWNSVYTTVSENSSTWITNSESVISQLTAASTETLNVVRESLSAADSSVFLTQDNNSPTAPRVICDVNLNKVKMVIPESDSTFYEEGWDYTSASWSNQGGAGATVFVGSIPSFNNFVDNTLSKLEEATLRVEYNNNDVLLTVTGWGFNGSDARIDTLEFPENPEAVTSVTFYYTFLNRIALDQDTGDYGIFANGTVNVESTSDIRIDAGDDLRLFSNDILSLRNRGNNDPVTIITNYGSVINPEREWAFNSAGETELPGIIKFKNNNNFNASRFFRNSTHLLHKVNKFK